MLSNREPLDEEESRRVEEASLPFLLNLSLIYLRLERPHKALQFGQKALKISPANTKALFRCGQVSVSPISPSTWRFGLAGTFWVKAATEELRGHTVKYQIIHNEKKRFGIVCGCLCIIKQVLTNSKKLQLTSNT